MRNRKKLGIIFGYSEQWIGGTYYIINLIHALNYLEDNNKPELIIFSGENDFTYLKRQVNYPYMNFELINENYKNLPFRIINKFLYYFFKRKFILRKSRATVDAIFPFSNTNYFSNVALNKRIYWIPDLQEKHLPDFFTEGEIKKRDEYNSWIACNSKKLVFSRNFLFVGDDFALAERTLIFGAGFVKTGSLAAKATLEGI